VSDALALVYRRHRDIFQQQVVGGRDDLDQAGKLAIDIGQLDDMGAHGVFVVGIHRLGPPSDDGHPFRIGAVRQGTHGLHVAFPGAPEDELAHLISRTGLPSTSKRGLVPRPG
jgi:hypothetical protein